ncbi:MAG: autotransporter outer membrane beta-barrel domain-containing protein [Chlamydiia bacterium]|nr:autotransporter outer membrane beta-barrel domain-containing protein [Chlamydiia bacterium]
MFRSIIFSILLVPLSLSAIVVTGGPTVYWLKRHRQGGAVQDGVMLGGRLAVERDIANGWFWGLDGAVAYGRLHGETGDDQRLKSRFLETKFEGNFGYAISDLFVSRWRLTPFAGYTYYHNNNRFISPSPLQVRFEDDVHMAHLGLTIDRLCFDPFEFGLRFRFKWMLEGESHVKDDPVHSEVTLKMDEKYQFALELPIAIPACHLVIVPFYTYRHFGGRENFPFDFLDTKYHSVGAHIHIRRFF